MKRLINRLPVTRIKLFLAGIIYRVVHLFLRKDRIVAVRGGITYELDLSEAVDLSMFLFGRFQKHVSSNKYVSMPKDAVIFDVGANVGIMSLQYASIAPAGRVYAFEPTHYAFLRLKRNLELNPELAGHISAIQTFVSSASSKEVNITAYSSWKVGGEAQGPKHGIHGGTIKSAGGVGAVSLDDFCSENGISRLDFIKIDTDGYEYEVLKGGRGVITEFKPTIIFEIGLYVMEEKNIEFKHYADFFDSLGYLLYNSSNFKNINDLNFREHIPEKGTIDILAIFQKSHADK
ncbi:MAG: FkbM family methyltransferase [Sedimentisphaerales bacterium]|nr:FkbM family methyltransferase [Sedimentisphaerales bacterium]